MRRPRGILLAAALAAAAVCGCERDHVEVRVELRRDGSLHRRLRLWHTSEKREEDKGKLLAPPEEMVARAAPHYGKPLADEEQVVRFEGTFRTVPADYAQGEDTNHGDYTVWASRLGAVGYYRERRPGRIDHHARLREAMATVDRLVDLMAIMARQRLHGEEGLDRLLAFLKQPLRRDLKEMVTYVLHAALGAPGRLPGEAGDDHLAGTGAFLIQFAEERGYFRAADLPRLLTEKGATDWATTLVAGKMGRPLDAVLRRKLLALTEPEHGEAAYVAALEELAIPREDFEKALQALANDLVHISFGGGTELLVSLVMPPGAQIEFSSGTRDEAGRVVSWTDSLDDRAVGMLYFAAWTAPDEAWQKAHLGRLALQGRELMEYVFWEHSLGDEGRTAWQAALDRLDPKGDLPKQLRGMWVRPPPHGAEPEPEKGAELILKALEPKPDGK